MERGAQGGPRVRVRGTTVTTLARAGTWLAWASTAVTGRVVGDAHEVVAVDVETGDVRRVAAMSATGIVTPFAGPGDVFVVREVELVPLSRCREKTTSCATWRLWTYEPRSGARTLVGSSEGAHTQAANPLPVAGAGLVAWQEARGGGVAVRVLRAGARAAETVLTAKRPGSGVTVAGGDVVLDDGDVPGRLLRLPGGRGPARVLVTAPVTYQPAGGTSFVSWLGGDGDAPTTVFAAPLDAPRSVATLAKADQLYWQVARADRLVYATPAGLWLVGSVRARTEPVRLTAAPDSRAGVALDADGRVFYASATEVGARETVVESA